MALQIERPLSSEDNGNAASGESITQFYSDAAQLMSQLVQQYGEKAIFVGDPKLQVRPAFACHVACHFTCHFA